MHNTTQYILAYEKLKTVSMEDKDLAVYESFKLAKEKISEISKDQYRVKNRVWGIFKVK